MKRVPLYLAGTGFHVPEERLTNADLEAMVDTSDEWIQRHIGIVERRRAADDVDTSDMAVRATREALVRAGWRASDLDLLVCATSTPDGLVPSTACIIGSKLKADPISFDINAACSGFLYGLNVVSNMVANGSYDRAALCVADKFTKVTDYEDRTTCVFFGDSASTVLVTRDKPESGLELIDLSIKNVNEGAEMVQVPLRGFFRQDGAQVKDYALKHFESSAMSMLDKHGLTPSDLRAFIGHQANYRILEEVAAKLGIEDYQHWHNVTTVGNQGAPGCVTTFCMKIEEHRDELRDGDLFLVTVFGAGFTTGSALFRWVG
ncbi:MAG TPA: beta-ketoacyl-ACP synthase 3 [Planctomycetota bacterium]